MRFVRYIGRAQQRVITAADWRQVGLDGETVQWSAFNGFAVPLDRFNEEQIRRAIEPDPTLVISGEGEDQDEEFKPTPQNRDMTPSELKQAVENPVDVLSMLEGGPTPSATAAPNGGNADEAQRREEILEDTPADLDESNENSDTRTNQDRLR
jgi:hypothetical protein